VDVLHRAMSSVQDRLAECEQCNGGHLEDVIFDVLHRAMSSVQDRLAQYEQCNGGHLVDVIFRVE
jgi:hypothetical protein